MVGPFRYYSLRPFLASVRKRTGRERVPEGVCRDCLGTLAMPDPDGAMTGHAGGVALCRCTDGDW